jgi:hypothetical protein
MKQVTGVKLVLDDGSTVLIPYTKRGLDVCAATRTTKEGVTTPHRPPDVARKCH